MKRLIGAVAAATVLTMTAAPALAQEGPPRHNHPFTTPNGGTHMIARGVTSNAPCTAFLNFHFKVHRGVFGLSEAGPFDVEGKHPLGPIPFDIVLPPDFC